ncbi:MAG: ABC transporter ATP-binding protein [Saprospiraceae bacterium]|jgi:ABC-type multidrug transport system ATPase subunit|nr:ABC transporter ATP-binding protein [Saprospiraceae bacterium]
MNISLENLGKRYRLEWVFRGINYRFEQGGRYAILGSNGSGKSTLMKVLSGHLSPSKGTVSFGLETQKISLDQVYKHVSYAAPYIDLIEELTLEEAIAFHSKIKPLLPGLTPQRIFDLLSLSRAKQKEIRHFSSGMKQRLKLALAICSDTQLLLLDEPSTNLDQQGIDWYKALVKEFADTRLTIIASNDPQDVTFCTQHLNVLDYKKQ